MSTDIDRWYASPVRDATRSDVLSQVPATRHKRLSGELTVDITWTGDSDIDIQLMEPSGRVLSWLSQRQRLKVSGVRGGNREQLALPTMRAGTYKVRLVRLSGQGPIKVQGQVTADGKRLTIDEVLDTEPVLVAEAVYSVTR